MKISDNELREKLLAELKRKGELATQSLVNFGNTWAGNSKIRDVLKGLYEEGRISCRRFGENKTAKVMWKVVESEEIKDWRYKGVQTFEVTEPVMKIKESDTPPLPFAQGGTVGVKQAMQELPEKLAQAEYQDSLNNTLRHEFEIILRKQQRRRNWAAKILQNSEATIKHLETSIKGLA